MPPLRDDCGCHWLFWASGGGGLPAASVAFAADGSWSVGGGGKGARKQPQRTALQPYSWDLWVELPVERCYNSATVQPWREGWGTPPYCTWHIEHDPS